MENSELFLSGRVAALRDAGHLDEALEVTNHALETVLPLDNRLSFQHDRMLLLYQMGLRQETMLAATEIIETLPQDCAAHFLLGNILDDVGDPWAARNHLLLSCTERDASAQASNPVMLDSPSARNLSAQAFNNLGVVYMHLGFLDRAEEVLEKALRLKPDLTLALDNVWVIWSMPDPHGNREVKQVRGPLPGCSECEALFMVSDQQPLLCAACAAHLAPTAFMDGCPHCEHHGVAFVTPQDDGYIPVLCPVCRIGKITAKDIASV